ncbi:MAG: metallophosphoesterase [Proteobacteria bacterium]|nr:metallophosphoesterase [Pseudomonadota bacterium]
MRYAIFGDIHANLEAFQTVLEDARTQGATDFVCLGDMVGYNADPIACLELVRDLQCPVVKGNHDEQASENTELTYFNPLAARAIQWTRDQLSPAHKDWLRALKFSRLVRNFTIVHATLDSPSSWGYIISDLDASASFSYQHTQLCFYGHTHVPRAFVRDMRVNELPPDLLSIEPGKKYFINAGSVGQPRDEDWRASYVLYSPAQQTVEWRRLEYDISTAQAKIIAAGLPERLATRLSEGR